MTEQNVTARKKSALEIFENIVILFFISSVIGLVYEFLFYIIVEHRVGNSGFFFGPCLPILRLRRDGDVLLRRRYDDNLPRNAVLTAFFTRENLKKSSYA